MHEPYRTLLGHFRHEIGHYYWDRLIKDTPGSTRFRALFGDERQDYGEALKRHYARGPRPTGRSAFVAPTPARTPGKTGPRPGPTTCT